MGASRKGHQRVAMTRWWLYGSGARWKAHQRVYNDSLVLEVAGRESKTGQQVAMTCWQLCGSGAKRKMHQRVVKRLVGARKGREVSLNDSLEGWRAGGGRSVGASRKGHQRVAMTRWWLYGSGARWKVHQRVYNDSLVLEVAGRVSKAGQRVAMTRWQLCGSGAKRKTHQRVV